MLADVAVEVEHVVIVQLIEDLAALLAVGDQTGGAEGAQLVGDGGFRGAKLDGEIADAVLLFFQQGDQPQPGGIREDGEEFAHALGLAHTQWRGASSGSMVVFFTSGFKGSTRHIDEFREISKKSNGQTLERMLICPTYEHYYRNHVCLS